jgi:hypothetical protein
MISTPVLSYASAFEAMDEPEFDRLADEYRALHAAAPGVLRYRMFFPRVLRSLRPLERALRWLPLGARYSYHASPA